MWSGVRSLVSTQGRRGKGTSIALIMHSLDLSLSSRLIAIRSVDLTLGLTKAGGRGIPIAVAIHSFDPTLQKGLIT